MVQRLAVSFALYGLVAWSAFGCQSRGFNSSTPNIVGGQDASPRPWFASLSGKDDEDPSCGASVVAEGVLLTAAHCVHGARDDIYVTVGHGTLEEFRTAPRVRVSSVRVHPQWDASSLAFDAALLFLSPADTKALGPKVETIPLASPSDDPGAFGKVTALGFGGILSYGWTGTSKLRSVEVPDVPKGTCQSAYPELLDSHLCAGTLGGGGDTCQGDSGGPLVFKSGASGSAQKDVLVGLTSYGNGCAQRLQPGVYTRVSAVRDWVQGEILREEALRKAVVGSVLHELTSSHCYPGVPQQASVSFDKDNSVTVRRRFFLPSPDARFARVTSKSSGEAMGQCVALGISVDAHANGKTEADAFVLESTLPSGETFRASAKEAFEAWGNCMTTPPPSASAPSGAAEPLHPQFLYFNIDPFWNSNGAMFGADWYSATSEDLSKASWEEKGRCKKDGLLVKFETAGTSGKWGRLLLEKVSTNELSKTFVFEKSEGGRGSGTAGVKATAVRVGSTSAILDLASQVDEQIFGVELACNQPFDVVLDGKPQAPRKVGDDFVHLFADPAKRASNLPGRGRTRSYLLQWKGWQPASGEQLNCRFNGNDSFSVTFD